MDQRRRYLIMPHPVTDDGPQLYDIHHIERWDEEGVPEQSIVSANIPSHALAMAIMELFQLRDRFGFMLDQLTSQYKPEE